MLIAVVSPQSAARPNAEVEVPSTFVPSGRALSILPRQRVGVLVSNDQQPDSVILEEPGLQHGPALTPNEARRLGLRPRGQALSDLRRWPSEPRTPSVIDRARFEGALGKLCPPWIDPALIRQLAGWILQDAHERSIDPMLLAALIRQQSGCDSHKRSSYGLGLAQINPGMYRHAIRGGRYHYWVAASPGRWALRSSDVSRFIFTPQRLLQPEANVYFAAAFLAAYEQQCPAIGQRFRSVPHRNPVAHFIWGDRVRDAGVEDQILRERRRLLYYYDGEPVLAPRATFARLSLGCPLDGAPRKVTGVMGDPRDGGRRRHTGIDLLSTYGEPVRAVADGDVMLAGIDWGEGRLGDLDPELAPMVAPARMGPRGILVTLKHAAGLRSTYMHLAAYVVRAGQHVIRGQLIGYVGASGIRRSTAHLHFELFDEGLLGGGHPIDPLPILRPYLFGPADMLLSVARAHRHEQRMGHPVRAGASVKPKQRKAGSKRGAPPQPTHLLERDG